MNTKRSIQKEAILHALCSVNSHPDADWIFAQVRRQLPSISLGTVYRNLSKFAAEGIIARLTVGGASDHYDGNPEPHYHLICSRCGAISDLDMAYQSTLNLQAEEISAGQITGHSLIFHGICKQCAHSIQEKTSELLSE